MKNGHSLRGECGLKSEEIQKKAQSVMSLSARRVWIEIGQYVIWSSFESGHSLRGECGLKYQEQKVKRLLMRHSLRGECGLKC